MRDINTRLADAQAFTSSGAVSTSSLALEVTGRDVAGGEPLAFVFTVTTAALVAASETYLFRVQSATNADGTTGAVILASTGTYTVSAGTTPIGALAAGAQIILTVPPEIIPATATHLAGYVVLGASGGISCDIDVVPLSEVPRGAHKYADAVTYAD